MKKDLKQLTKRILVTTLVFAPTLTDTRIWLVSKYRGAVRRPLEPAFRILKSLAISNKRVIIDIGGGTGGSVAALRLFAKSARIISFEPNHFFATKIERRFRSDSEVEVRRCAIGDCDGLCRLYLPAYRYTLFPELATVTRTEAENWLCSRIIGFDVKCQTVLERECASWRLDSLDLDPEIIKIDTRCDVSAVVRGASNTITKSRPLIMVENAFLTGECERFLIDAGYLILSVRAGTIAYASKGSRCDILMHSSVSGLMHLSESSGRALQ